MFTFCTPGPLNLGSINTFESTVILLTNLIPIFQAVNYHQFLKRHVLARPAVGIPMRRCYIYQGYGSDVVIHADSGTYQIVYFFQ